MNTLLLCGLQVTLVAIVGCLTSLIMRRWLRTSAALPIGATLAAVVLLTACAFSPWPSWLHRPDGVGAKPETTGLLGTTPPAFMNDPVLSEYAEVITPTPFGYVNVPRWAWPILYGTPAHTASLKNEESIQATAGHWTWLQIIGALFATGILCGLVRVIGGLWAVRLFVRTSRPLTTPELLEQIDLLRAEMGCSSPVEVRECPHLATAATVGWRRPVILLSESWRTWDAMQLKSVLAHEIAHITRGDFLAGVAAQLGVVLHFYHPLVHWLVNRLRLEQELAADALAAQVVGGSRAYLHAIGELALRQTNEPLGWPAQTFLPTRRTFLRRIEMLRDLKLLSGPAPLALRWGTLAAIAAVTLVAIGLRPPGGEPAGTSTVVAADPPKATLAGTSSGGVAVQGVAALTPLYVPADASVVISVRASDLYKLYSKLSEKYPQLASPESARNGSPEPIELFAGCEQACLSWTPIAPTISVENGVGRFASSGKISVIYCLTLTDKNARELFLKTMDYPGPDWQQKSFATFEYHTKADGTNADMTFFMPDDKTLVFGDDEALTQKVMLIGASSKSPLTLTDSWKQASHGTAVIAIDPTIVQTLGVAGSIPDPFDGMFSPLWESASNHTIGLKLEEKLALTLTSQAKDDAGAEKISATLAAGVAMLNNITGNLKNSPEPGMVEMEKTLSTMLNSHKLAANGQQVTLSLSGDVGELMSLAVEPIMKARAAAQRSQQQNNLKQIMLAMHNYHDVFGHFPPAVVIDKASGVPHSWRVEILPYLDQQLLYDQYKLNEPWDSEANKKVLALMPAPYWHPSPGASTNTAIVAAYGKGLIFEEKDEDGTKIREIFDGTSNTIAVLESKTEIPWTKPEDPVIDLNNIQLPVGFTDGVFHVGCGDGSVRTIANAIDLELLKKMLTKAGGEPFDF